MILQQYFIVAVSLKTSVCKRNDNYIKMHKTLKEVL